MKRPTLGYKSDSRDDVVVNVERLIASRMLVQANSGAGKSRALRQQLEETHGRVQHIVLDPEGEFSTLRERFPYVLAGRDGDVQAHPKTARLLCRKLMELGASAVLDLYDLPLADRREFVKLFLLELMALPRSLWRPLLVVIDEAHVFCPERGSGEAQSTEAVITLCTQGRKRGYCAVLATQRISKLHKDAAAELLNKLVGRTGLDVDVKRAGDELGFDKEQRQELKTLEPGEFFAYGPAISQSVVRVRTGDVTTSHPEAGKVGAAPPPPSAAVKRVLAEFGDLTQQAVEEARTIADLEKRNRELTAQLRRAEKGGGERVVEKPIVDQVAIDRAVQRAIADAARDTERRDRERGKVANRIASVLDKRGGNLKDIGQAIVMAGADLANLYTGSNDNGTHGPAPVRTSTPVAERPRLTQSLRSPVVATAEGVTLPQQRILNALASLHDLGLDVVQKSNVAVFADQSPTSSGFANNLGALRSAGLIDYPQGGFVALTDAGRAIAEGMSIESLRQLHAAWERKLSRPQWAILAPLIEAYPSPIEREQLAEHADQSPTSSGYANNLGSLRSLGLIDYRPAKHVVATPLLFPEGLT